MGSRLTNRLTSDQPQFDFVTAHFQCEANPYSLNNPSGYVNFGSAQNHLHAEELQQRLQEVAILSEDTRYQVFSGTRDCKAAVATFLSTYSKTIVSPQHLVIGNGAISLLEALAFALMNPGDSVLVPTPVFPGLVTALSLRTGAQVKYHATGPRTGFGVTPAAMEQALIEQRAAGARVKAILLCSPGNPVGQVFEADELAEFVELAELYDCALIVDEIYAASCFEGVTFASALPLQSEQVFVLGGLSKDFGLAGLAVGWLHGLDPQIMAAVSKQAHFYRLPVPVQRQLEIVLEPTWRDAFIAHNRNQLTELYFASAKQFNRMRVPVFFGQAGLCLWFDLRSFLPTPDTDGELQLYHTLLNRYRVHISPGTGFHCSTPGCFRICFSQPPAVLQEGLRRIQQALHDMAFSHSSEMEVIYS